VADAAVGLDFDQAADVHLDLLAEVAFYPAFLLDGLAEAVYFVFGQVADFFVVINVGLFGQLFRAFLSDAVDRREADIKAFLHRKIYTCYTCHTFSLTPESLSLTLLVLRVGADYADYAATVDDFAFVANLFY